MTPLPILSALFIFALLLFSGGCGGTGNAVGDAGGGPPSKTSRVSGSKRLSNLTDADKKAICDWTASLYGGYGKSLSCGGDADITLTVTGPATQPECLARAALVSPACQATVAQSEACVQAMASCDDSNNASACAAMQTCAATQ
jgi:hypothetical protein